jgi:hypothetical protein
MFYGILRILPRMKLALSNLAWNPAYEDAAIALMQKYGFMGIETVAARYDRWSPLPVVAFQALFFTEPNLQMFIDQDGAYEHLFGIACDALDAETKVMVLGAPKNRVGGNLMNAVPFFQRCAREGIPLCIEPNPPQYGCNFITNTKEARELVAAVNHPNFRLHLDSGIMTLNGETEIPPDIAHFHVSQPYLAPVGPGTVDHVAMAATLRAINYKGWCSVEMLPCENLEKSLEYAAGIYGD